MTRPQLLLIFLGLAIIALLFVRHTPDSWLDGVRGGGLLPRDWLIERSEP